MYGRPQRARHQLQLSHSVDSRTPTFPSNICRAARAASNGSLSVCHVAIIAAALLAPLQAGVKTIETRFMTRRRPPWNRVSPGDLVYFKCSGGDYQGWTRVIAVRQYADLTPGRLNRLRRLYGKYVAAPAAYWHQRRFARYAVLFSLGSWVPLTVGPPVPRQFGSGWVVLCPPLLSAPLKRDARKTAATIQTKS